MNYFLFVILVVYVIYVIEKKTQVLEGLSDDINEIKKKLGLETHIRTPEQLEKVERDAINRSVLWGSSLKDLKKEYGFKFVWRNRQFIDSCIQNYDGGNGTVCPKCGYIYNFTELICQNLKCRTDNNESVEVIKASEYKKRISGK